MVPILIWVKMDKSGNLSAIIRIHSSDALHLLIKYLEFNPFSQLI